MILQKHRGILEEEVIARRENKTLEDGARRLKNNSLFFLNKKLVTCISNL